MRKSFLPQRASLYLRLKAQALPLQEYTHGSTMERLLSRNLLACELLYCLRFWFQPIILSNMNRGFVSVV